jgi:hypothetical protein
LNIGTTAIVAAFAFMPTAPSPIPSVAGSGVPLEEVATGSGAVVVNEFASGAYVELRNNAPSVVDISGFSLWLCELDGVATEVRVSLGRALSPGEFYVLASASYTGAPADQTYRGVLPGGGATLLDPDHAWVDGAAVVAHSPCGEGPPAPVCPQASVARDAAGADTGSNAADFACRTRSPGEQNPAG